MSNARNAALQLYGLHSDDRDWLLDQLPDDVCSSLLPLIDELNELNFSRDSINDISSNLLEGSDVSSRIDRSLVINIHYLENSDLGIIKHCLTQESPEVISIILSLTSSEWRDIFLKFSNFVNDGTLRTLMLKTYSVKVSESLLSGLIEKIRSKESDVNVNSKSKSYTLAGKFSWLG